MFEQIINVLSKKENEKEEMLILVLKIIFTATISAKLYTVFFGAYYIISITNYQEIVNFFIDGRAIICFVIFSFIWFLSYHLPAFFLFPKAASYNLKLNLFLAGIAQVKSYELITLLQKDKKDIPENEYKFVKFTKWILDNLNMADVIELEYEKKVIKPGTNYFQFYDYLIKVEKGEASPNPNQFLIYGAFIFQFIVVYFCYGLTFLTSTWWLYIIDIIIIAVLIISLLIVFQLFTFIE